MTITTRYRDVPLEEIPTCCRAVEYGGETKAGTILSWATTRGQPVTIVVPALSYKPPDAVCDGPWFNVLGKNFAVSPCVVEIGD